MLTYEILREIVAYDPIAGTLKWKTHPRINNIGKDAISKSSANKITVRISYLTGEGRRIQTLSACKVAWILHYKKLPAEGEYIYPIDWDSLNIQPNNLECKKPTDRGSATLGVPLTRDRALQVLNYSADTGELSWKIRMGNSPKGKTITTTFNDGYICVRLDGISYLGHRVIWLMQTGEYPPEGLWIDHKNRIKNDNKWENLRLATPSENTHNQVDTVSSNTTRFTGVQQYRDGIRWLANIWVNNRCNYLGIFSTKEEAASAYAEAKEQYFPGLIER